MSYRVIENHGDICEIKREENNLDNIFWWLIWFYYHHLRVQSI